MASVDFHVFSPAGIAYSFGILIVSVIFYVTGTVIYNLFISPLRLIPGPRLAGATGIPYALHVRSGTIVDWVQKLHEQYGDVVRVAPTELSFNNGETSWPEIYGHRTGKFKDTGAYLKDPTWFARPSNGVHSLIVTNEADHTRVRRNLAHAFSAQALRNQEPLIMSYVDLLIHRLQEHAEENKQIDIMLWYNFTTFDVIADLAFGEPLYCLRDSQEHKWVRMVFRSIMAIPISAVRNNYVLFRWLDKAKHLFTDTESMIRSRHEFYAKAHDLVTARLETETGKPDFFSSILQNQDKDSRALTRGEMDSNAFLLLAAGSETTATTLSGVTYLLLKHPAVYARLANDIRLAFAKSEDITVEAVSNLPYLIATLQETLRFYPPVPTGFPRVVPGKGQQLSGHFVPGGTSVYVSQHATNHSPRNFSEPDTFAPERWLADRPEKFEMDKREAVQPFSFGPRNCLGKSLAFAEMRLILAKVLWHFDLELVNPKQDWMRQRVFALWEKPALDVRLTPVVR